MSKITVEYVYKRTFATNVNVIKHNHSCYELVYFIDGKGTTAVNVTDTLRYSANQYVIYNPFSYHDEIHQTETTVKGFGFTIPDDDPLIPQAGIFSDRSKDILHLVDQIYNELDRKLPFYEQAMNSYLQNLLIMHCRDTSGTLKKDSLLKHIIAYLDENYLQQISLQELADMSRYSYDRFRHLFKEMIGVSPKNYILHKRITHAKRLLMEEKLSVTEVAYQCGFSTTAEFDRSFKRRVGVSPLRYRKEHMKTDAKIDTLSQK